MALLWPNVMNLGASKASRAIPVLTFFLTDLTSSYIEAHRGRTYPSCVSPCNVTSAACSSVVVRGSGLSKTLGFSGPRTRHPRGQFSRRRSGLWGGPGATGEQAALAAWPGAPGRCRAGGRGVGRRPGGPPRKRPAASAAAGEAAVSRENLKEVTVENQPSSLSTAAG